MKHARRCIRSTAIVVGVLVANSVFAQSLIKPVGDDFDRPENYGTMLSEERQRLAEEPTHAQKTFETQLGAGVATSAALTTGKGDPKLEAQLATYYLKLGDEIFVPFWLTTSLPTSAKLSKDNVLDAILSETSGLLHLSFSSAGKDGQIWRKVTKGYNGICKFTDDQESGYGCYWSYNAGIKAFEAPINVNNETTKVPEVFIGAAFHAQFPILQADRKTGAGMAAAGLAVRASTVDAKKLEYVLGQRIKNTLATLDASFSFNVIKQLNISAGATLANTQAAVGKRAFVTVALKQNL